MYPTYIMRRTQIYLDEGQDRALARRARAQGVTKSSLIRQAIDRLLEGPEADDARLERFREAVRSAAGSAASLPAGKDYVEELRRADRAREEALAKRRS